MSYDANNAAAYNSGSNPGGMSDVFTNLLGDAQFAAYENSIARQIVTAFDYPQNAGKTIQIPVYSAVTAGDLTEGTAPSAQTSNAQAVTITLGEIGTYFQVTDFLRDSAERNVIADLGLSAGRAIAEKMDSKVFSLFNSFSASVGTQDSAITVDNLFDAIATLRGNKVTGPLFAVVGPRQALQLKKALYNAGGTVATASSLGSAVLERGFIGTIGGCTIFESSLVKSDLDGDADSELNMVGAVFAPTALAHVMRGGVALETQRQAAARATEVMLTAVVGQGILQNSHGVKIVGSATD
jgi:N4-gp56 family major capsid protein